MGYYGLESRLSKPRDSTKSDYGTIQQVPYTETFPRLFSSKLETVRSYRSDLRGTLVPDWEADPYAHFLINGAARKIDSQLKEHTYPIGIGKEVIVGTNPSNLKHPPHVDNGHSFYKTEQSVWTSANKNNHPYSRRTNGPASDPIIISSGGPLFASGAEINSINAPRMLFKYSGAIGPNFFGKISTDKTIDLHRYGQKAIADHAPTRPDISLAAILGELREGLPSLIGMSIIEARAKRLRRGVLITRPGGKKQVASLAGKEWVNLNFGIVPLMSDIRKIIEALTKVSDTLVQYERDAGNGVRRRVVLKTRDSYEAFTKDQLAQQGNFSLFPGTVAPSAADYGSSDWHASGVKSSFVTQQLKEKISFSGSFTYYVPLGKDFSSNIDKYRTLADRLFGLSITPEVLWQLQPWSWLADWLFDIGTTISSYERIRDENLVINYGYVMGTSVKKSTMMCTVDSPFATQTKEVMTTVTSVRKERVRANPYGFSATTAQGLNLKQWSILAALGFSRLG